MSEPIIERTPTIMAAKLMQLVAEYGDKPVTFTDWAGNSNSPT